VKVLNPDARSPILCFVGPPGVGKTSLGKSIARSMNRSFHRISLGGVKDEADVRGHRRTYVGAYPGRVVQGIKASGSANPVIMLDEIDKLASDHRGDPSSALLEVLDPEQNKGFVDHYLGVPFDLSRVMFIANANNIEMVPAPLRDRMEIIEVSGYTDEEKLAIANQYLIPKQMKETGLPSEIVAFNKSSLMTIINAYTRESGLRGLEKQIASVCRKIARGFAEKGGIHEEDRHNVIKLTPSLVERHLGAKKFTDEFYHLEPTPGVSLGLAYTSYGGEVLAIETNLIPGGRGNLTLTGHLGDVMKESATAALSYIRAHAKEFGVDLRVLKTHEIHVHLPAGAIPKDGPSAGIALATSILSALLKKAPAARTAMTGEITLHGKVLPIGGVKEKLLGAHREGVTHVILPKGNTGHFNALPAQLKKRFTINFVTEYTEVFQLMFHGKAAVEHDETVHDRPSANITRIAS
jgi:ATP-dependent Lon protease